MSHSPGAPQGFDSDRWIMYPGGRKQASQKKKGRKHSIPTYCIPH